MYAAENKNANYIITAKLRTPKSNHRKWNTIDDLDQCFSNMVKVQSYEWAKAYCKWQAGINQELGLYSFFQSAIFSVCVIWKTNKREAPIKRVTDLTILSSTSHGVGPTMAKHQATLMI